uniref:transposase n=1 Tax=Acetobacter vaccinii TaxID=2592655 RepID=UPI0038D09C75
MTEDAQQRHHDLRELFNCLRYMIRYGIAWRAMPNDLPPWTAAYQQARRWMEVGCFEAVVHDLRAVLRHANQNFHRKTGLDGGLFITISYHPGYTL